MIFRLLNTLILASILFLVGVIAFAVLESPPKTDDLDADLVGLRRQLATLETEGAKYEGGMLKTLIEIDARITSITVNMLEQKRLSHLRNIKLVYQLDEKGASPPATPETLQAIQRDMSDAAQKASTAQSEAERYSGGLVQALALMRAQTERLTAAVLNFKYMAAKHGIGLQLPELGSRTSIPPAPAGKVVRDKEAL